MIHIIYNNKPNFVNWGYMKSQPLGLLKSLMLSIIIFYGCESMLAQDATIDLQKEWHDFGLVKSGEKVHVDFKFKNSGDQVLVISSVDAGCSCTVPSWPKKPIKPGENGSIRVSYDSKTKIGAFNKAIRISSNAKMPTKIIRIKGLVQ